MSQRPQPVMDQDAVWAAVDRERAGLVELLDTFSELQWQQHSLCAGWRVRDVAAHLALAHTGPVRAGVDLVRAGGNFDRMIRETAIRRAVAPPEELVAAIRAMVGSRRRAAGVSCLEPLLDVLVHGQDITVPLGIPRPMPVAAATAAATRVWTMGWPLSTAFHARSRLRGLRMVATDVDWAVGEGARVEGPIEALLLLLTGRAAAVRGRLTGEGMAGLAPAAG